MFDSACERACAGEKAARVRRSAAFNKMQHLLDFDTRTQDNNRQTDFAG